jgi:hypothetical protein
MIILTECMFKLFIEFETYLLDLEIQKLRHVNKQKLLEGIVNESNSA